MEKVGRATSKLKDLVEVQIKSTKSVEASKYGVQDTCIVIDCKIRLSSNFDEKKLEDTILKREQENLFSTSEIQICATDFPSQKAAKSISELNHL
jgi:hypothetical protein